MLSTKAILVNLSISQWGARKLDRVATNSVENQFGTSTKVGNFSKKLLPTSIALARIDSISGAFRKYFAEQTLPWMSDGTRILSSKNYVEFTTEYRKRKMEFESAVNDFLVEYPNARETAREKLGELFNENEYPSETRLRRKFTCDVRFFPVPDVSDFRTEILDSEKTAFLENMRNVETEIMRDCWNRMYSVVKNASEKLQNPKAIFRDSLIENISEICALLPKLNVTDNAELETMRREIESFASKVSPETCRVNLNERMDAAAKLNEMSDRMSAFMCGAQ
jgi:hypothetical protein